MDSRTGFATLLVIIGLVGMWALVTGKLQGLIASYQQQLGATKGTQLSMTPLPPGVAPAQSVAFSLNLYDPHLPMTSSLSAYGIGVGGNSSAPAGSVQMVG